MDLFLGILPAGPLSPESPNTQTHHFKDKKENIPGTQMRHVDRGGSWICMVSMCSEVRIQMNLQWP